MSELQQLASKLPWTNALEVWKLNRTFKKRKGQRKGANGANVKPSEEIGGATGACAESQEQVEEAPLADGLNKTEEATDTEITSTQDSEEAAPGAKITKFRVTCNRAGDKHSFSSNEAARDFGGAVQEFFQWKADMTKFDIEVSRFVPSRLTHSEYPFSRQKKKKRPTCSDHSDYLAGGVKEESKYLPYVGRKDGCFDLTFKSHPQLTMKQNGTKK